MALDLNSLLLGLAVAGVPLLAFIWQLQRRASAINAERALLDERLSMAQLAQEGLNAQLDASRDEISDLGQANAAKQAELAALRREVELLQVERDNARDAAHAWNLERAQKEVELRRLDAQVAAQAAELREQQRPCGRLGDSGFDWLEPTLKAAVQRVVHRGLPVGAVRGLNQRVAAALMNEAGMAAAAVTATVA